MTMNTIIRSTVNLDPINNLAILPANPSFILLIIKFLGVRAGFRQSLFLVLSLRSKF